MRSAGVMRFRRWPWRSVWVKSGYQRRIHHLLNRWTSELARRGVDVDLGATAAESGPRLQGGGSVGELIRHVKVGRPVRPPMALPRGKGWRRRRGASAAGQQHGAPAEANPKRDAGPSICWLPRPRSLTFRRDRIIGRRPCTAARPICAMRVGPNRRARTPKPGSDRGSSQQLRAKLGG